MMMTRLLGELVATRHPDRRDIEHAAERARRGALRRRRLPARDPGALRPLPTMRIDGLDYRRRDIEGARPTVDDRPVDRWLGGSPARGARSSPTTSTTLVAHLATVHPSKYVKLIDGVDVDRAHATCTLHRPDRRAALRRVRRPVYDAQMPVLASGIPLDEVFGGDMLARRLPQEVPARHRPRLTRRAHSPPPHGRAVTGRTPSAIGSSSDGRVSASRRNTLFTWAVSRNIRETCGHPPRNVSPPD